MCSTDIDTLYWIDFVTLLYDALCNASGERAVISGGIPLSLSPWEPIKTLTSTTRHSTETYTIYRATLTKPLPPNMTAEGFTGLFAANRRMTRARYPNCPDITGTDCYLLNASGKVGKDPVAPAHDLDTEGKSH